MNYFANVCDYYTIDSENIATETTTAQPTTQITSRPILKPRPQFISSESHLGTIDTFLISPPTTTVTTITVENSYINDLATSDVDFTDTEDTDTNYTSG